MTDERLDHVARALHDRWETACRNIQFQQRELLKKIEAEKSAHAAVEAAKHDLNEEVEARRQHEDAMRKLGIPIPEEEPEG